MAIQWLGLNAFTAEGPGSTPGQGTKILQAAWHSQKKKKKIKRNSDAWVQPSEIQTWSWVGPGHWCF